MMSSEAEALKSAFAGQVPAPIREYINASLRVSFEEESGRAEGLKAAYSASTKDYQTKLDELARKIEELGRLLATPTTVRRLGRAIDLLTTFEAHDVNN